MQGRGGRLRRASGISLTEVLLVLAIVAMFASSALLIAVSMTGRFSPVSSTKSMELEAEYARLWVENIFLRALLERRFFTLISVADYPVAKLRVRWDDDLSQEEFQSDKIAFIADGVKSSFSYTPQWHTLTPAARLKVYPTGSRGGRAVAVIVISAYCRVSTE